MTLGGVLPEALLTITAGATVFTVMFHLGLGIVPGELRWVAARPWLFVRALVVVLVVVPTVAVLVVQAFDLSRAAQIGVVLMAIAPGAPIALRRSIDAGGHQAFAPALQVALALLAVGSMPLWVALLDFVYAGNAHIDFPPLARQVFLAQLLPLALGVAARATLPAVVAKAERSIGRVATVLLVLLTVLAVIDAGAVAVSAGPRIGAAVVTVTAVAIAAGHWAGGPHPGTRTATAIAAGVRNPGLALLVATLNHAPPEITRVIVAHLVVSALVVLPYVLWRRRAKPPASETP